MKLLVLSNLFLITFSVLSQEPIKFQQNGKYGYKNQANKIIVPAKYDWIGNFHYGFAAFSINSKYGFVNERGFEVVGPKYETYWSPIEKNRAVVRLKGKWGIVDLEKGGQEILKPSYDSITYFDGAIAKRYLSRYSRNGKWGIMDLDGKELSEPIYDKILKYDMPNAIAAVQKGNLWGFVNENGVEVVPCKYEAIYVSKTYNAQNEEQTVFTYGRGAVSINNSWGFVSRNGQEVIPLIYSKVTEFYNGYSKASSKEGITTIDRYGHEFNDKYASKSEPVLLEKISRGSKHGMKDVETGKEVLPCEYENVSYSNGYISFKQNGKWGVADKYGNITMEAQFDFSPSFSEGYFKITDSNKKNSFIDESGKTTIATGFDEAYPFNGGCARVALQGKWGLINKQGKLITPHVYASISTFKQGIAKIGTNGKYGLIDSTGKIILSPRYDRIEDFVEGLAAVELNSKWGFVDMTGKELIKPQYDYIPGTLTKGFHDGLCSVELNKKSGFIDKSGKIVIPLTYDAAYNFSEGFACVKLGDKWGFITPEGKIHIPIELGIHGQEGFRNGFTRMYNKEGILVTYDLKGNEAP